jgi:hypothetical protein
MVHSNAGITVKCLLSDVWYFTFLQSLFFLWWNYMPLGIEALFDLSIFTTVDKVKDCILYNKVWKDNWTCMYCDTCQYYILYCSIVTIWVPSKEIIISLIFVLTNLEHFKVIKTIYHHWLLGNDHLTWRGGGLWFFSKKKILIPNVAEKNILILVEEKKIIWFRDFVI